MYQCELFSIEKSTTDREQLSSSIGKISTMLSDNNITLGGITKVSADAKKIAAAAADKLDGGADLFLFANALTGTDSSSFRKLFYQLIGALENGADGIKVRSLGDLGNGCRGYCFEHQGKRFIALPYASLTGKEITSLITEALAKADQVLSQQPGDPADMPEHEVSPAQDAAAPKKKQGFFKSFIPMKEDSKGLKTRKIIVLVAMVAFIGALIYVLEFFIFGPMRNSAVTSEIQEIAYSNTASDNEDDNGPAQDWDALKKVNDEIVGWITIPDTVIDYPVLYHEGDDRYNQYYIKRTYKKESSEYGSIFVDYRSTDGTRSRNVIMHGHDMNDGSMFAGLLKYSPKGELKGNLSYYQEHPVITFNTPDGDAKYKIISVFKTSTRYEHGEFFNYMQGEFNSDAEFMNFVYNTRIRSMFNIPVTCNEDDQIITLSTCCYEFYQWRCVVVARKVRPGEDENVDVNLATLNSAPLFPDVYYQRYGGTRPDPDTFKSANAEGKVDWYDGKGNLEGSEDLTATLASNPTEPPTEKPKKNTPKATEPPSIIFYPVTYRNYDGSQYAAYNVKEGDPVPIPDGTPTMPEDEYYTYVFTGWDRSVEGVDFDHLNVGIDIYPNFEAVLKE